MSDTPNGVPPQDSGTQAPDGASAGGHADADQWRNPAEIKRGLSKIRDLENSIATLTQQLSALAPAQAPAKKRHVDDEVASELAAIREERASLALERELTRRGFTPDEHQAKTLELLRKANPGNTEWIDTALASFGRTSNGSPAKSEPTNGASAAPAARTGSLGTPAAATSAAMPTDPAELARRGIWGGLTAAQRREVRQQQLQQSSPFAARFASAAPGRKG